MKRKLLIALSFLILFGCIGQQIHMTSTTQESCRQYCRDLGFVVKFYEPTCQCISEQGTLNGI